jgi:hypothetical protein
MLKVELGGLHEFQAAEFFIQNTQRKITRDELCLSDESEESILTRLSMDSTIAKCKGYPKYLKNVANLLSEKRGMDMITI